MPVSSGPAQPSTEPPADASGDASATVQEAPPVQPSSSQPPAAAAAQPAPGSQPELQEVTHPEGYPRVMVKGGMSRTVPNAAEENRLRFDGWRLQDEPAPQRGSFLPPPTTASTAAEGDQPDGEPRDNGGTPPATHARPAGRRRK